MLENKVNFMLIGAMKCGTTSLAHILKNHPEIGFSNRKEPHFFSNTENWEKNIDTYHDLFNFNEGNIFGEASTTFTQYPTFNLEIWNDIFNYNPHMKFLYLVRNPVDRAISHYMHNYHRGYYDDSIEVELGRSNIINVGRYYTQIIPFIERFGFENVLIIDFDDFIENRNKVLKQISKFLNINFNKFTEYENVHRNISVGGEKPPIIQDKVVEQLDRFNFFPILGLIPKRIRKIIEKKIFDNSKRKFTKKPELTHEFKEIIINLSILDILELEKLTKKDFSKWKTISD